MDQYIGKLLDNRYELLERIGNGGMAVVYKARCHRLNRLVAVKILKPDLASDAEFRRRFHDESRAVAMLSHANIVSVYDVSSSDDLDYIVMELIDGISLKQYMQRRGVPLNWREALHFTIQIVKALGHAHGRGIIHRDIKPHNVMVLRDGSIKVADFGIARLINGGESTLTQEALGSVHYISPEQARGSRIDGRADLYSAGVVLYEMITGRLPFEGETPVSVAIQHINSIPLSPRELNPALPEALEAITMKAMAPRVEQRYASADEMLADLEEFRKNPNLTIANKKDAPIKKDEKPAESSGKPAETEKASETVKETEQTVDEPTQIRPAVVIEETETVGEKKPDSPQEKAESDHETEKKQVKKREKEYDYRNDYVKHRGGGFAAGFFAVLLILLLVCGIVFFLWRTFLSPMLREPESYKVPDVLGMTLSEIYADRSITGTFQILEGTPIYDENYELGEVVRQSPAAGETVRESGLSITVQINTEVEAKELRMPNVLNWDQRRVLTELQDEMGLRVNFVYEHNDKVNEGYVIHFTPLDGVILQPGDSVTVFISQGPDSAEVTVPLVEGQSIDEAKKLLEGLDLTVKVIELHSETVKKGLVVFQSIKATTEVAKGTSVTLQVSLGSANPSNTGSQTPDASSKPTGGTGSPGDIPASTVTKELKFSLLQYKGTVHLRVVVGDNDEALVVMDGQVNTDIETWTGSVSHSGRQMVRYYVNGRLAKSEAIEFS